MCSNPVSSIFSQFHSACFTQWLKVFALLDVKDSATSMQSNPTPHKWPGRCPPPELVSCPVRELHVGLVDPATVVKS